MKLQFLLLSTLWALHHCQNEAPAAPAPTPTDANGEPAADAAKQNGQNGTVASTPQQSWVYYQSQNPRASQAYNQHMYRTGVRSYHNGQYQQYYSQLLAAQQAAAHAAAACQGQMQTVRAESEAKQKKFEQWYLNMQGHDVLFSICGNLLPAHRLLIESSSKKFGEYIETRKGQNPISIQNLKDLVNDNEKDELCPSEKFLEAFKIFLKYFYIGQTAFNGIEDLDIALMVWRLAKNYLPEPDRQMVEPKIIDTMNQDSLIRIHRFIKNNDLQSLKPKWTKFIGDNSNRLIDSEQQLPLSCDEVQTDIGLLDDFLSGMNTTQERIINIIQDYLEKCPQLKTLINDANSFPNSLAFYRCTLDNLKQLVKMNFLKWENYAEELENRLMYQRHECDETLRKVAPTYYATHVRPHLIQQQSVQAAAQSAAAQQQQQQQSTAVPAAAIRA